jgi:hypothetical protein
VGLPELRLHAHGDLVLPNLPIARLAVGFDFERCMSQLMSEVLRQHLAAPNSLGGSDGD